MPFQSEGLRGDRLPIPLVTFLGILVAHPQAGIEFIVRNFNTIEPPHHPKKGSRLSVFLRAYLPEDREHQDPQVASWVGTERVNLTRVLPSPVMELLRGERVSATNTIGYGAFLKHAQAIADALGRPVVITHQYGGNMEYASYDEYHPFTPGGKGKITIARSIGPAFMG